MKDISIDLIPTDQLSTPTPVPSRKELRPTPIHRRVQLSRTTGLPVETINQTSTHLLNRGGRILQNTTTVSNDLENITLLPTSLLPDRLRSLFPFEYFNAMQSKAFQSIYELDNNIVLSAPTGSGKTICFEFAIAKLMRTDQRLGSYKVSLR
jgi:superfamily II RNA helicase